MADVRYHQVKRGDTLSGIGSRLGVPWQQLAAYNQLENPNRLRPGDVIMVPLPRSPETRMRVDAAKQAPAAQAVVNARPSAATAPPVPANPQIQEPLDDQGRPIRFEIDMGGPRPRPLPAQAQEQLAPPSAPAPQGPELSDKYAKPYPPGPEKMAYPEFWGDFLERSLPTALAGIGAGQGGALMRAASKLAQIDNPFQAVNPGLARVMQKGQRYLSRQAPENRDPNYWEWMKPENRVGAAYDGPSPSRLVGQAFRNALGFPAGKTDPMTQSLAVAKEPLRHEIVRTSDEARRVAERSGPGADYPKGYSSAHAKSAPGVEHPFAKAAMKGMTRAVSKAVEDEGFKMAGEVLDARQMFGRKQNLEGGNVYRGGGGSVSRFPNQFQRTERALDKTRTQQEKYDDAVAVQQGRKPVQRDDFSQFEQAFTERLKSFGPQFEAIPPAFVKDAVRNFYRNPEATLADLQRGITSLPEGPVRREAIWFRQMLEEELH